MRESYILVYWIVSLGLAAGLGFIPAGIAKRKGYSFGLWWLYGFLLFIVAIIHVSLIQDKNVMQQNFYNSSASMYPSHSPQNIVDEIKKFKELYDQGVISTKEFQMKKEQLLKLL